MASRNTLERGVTANKCLFIGIDFGTTFTGVAWAFSQRTDAVKVVQWGSGGSKYKVPSTICYQKDGSKTWGFDASPEDPNTLEWFKLLLVDEKDMKENIKSCHYIQKARAALAKAGKQPQEVVRDYLSLVWTSAIGSIVKEARRVVVDGLPFRVELTVPATWGEIPYASNRLYQAAVEAGILATRRCGDTELHISHEPEAAAFSTLVDARSDGHLSVGDIFIMCDAGGGTVDLVTYEMEDRDRMKVRECVLGDGGVCGSIFLDQEMEDCMGRWLGRRWKSLNRPEREEFKNDKWMDIKCRFEGAEQPVSARLPKGTAMSRFIPSRPKEGALRVYKNYIFFEKQNLVTIFSKVETQIIDLVGEQISLTKARERRSPKVLILVGGLGSNKYLYNRLENAYPELDIIQRDGYKPITAICRGAVLKARSRLRDPRVNMTLDERISPDPTVSTRVARLSLGVSYFETFDSTKHNPAHKKFENSSQKEVVSDLMDWYVKKGDDISEINRPTRTFKRAIDTSPPGNQMMVQIWQCDSENPPNSKRDREDVIPCTDILCDIITPFDQLPLCLNRAYREIVFQLDLDPRGAMLQFIAKINGEVRGQKNLDISFINRS